jgi:hypothetical protein
VELVSRLDLEQGRAVEQDRAFGDVQAGMHL